MQEKFLNYRIEGESWWRSEMLSEEEMEAGLRKLEGVDWKVDYVLTHECPTSTLNELSDGAFPADRVTDYLEGIKQKLDYKTWYFGHHHDNIAVTDKDIMLYTRILNISSL